MTVSTKSRFYKTTDTDINIDFILPMRYQDFAVIRFFPIRNASIETYPDVCGGEPVIVGTRINISHIWALSAKLGWSIEKILASYPQLKYKQVYDAIKYVYESPELQKLEDES